MTIADDNKALFASPADWVSPDGVYLDPSNPTPATGDKVVFTDTDHIFADTDHIFGVGGDCAWVWKTFTRGNNPLYMDPYGDPGNPPADEGARRAMGQALTYAGRMDLQHMAPRGDLTSTGYALAKLGLEYPILQAADGAFTLNLSNAPGRFAAEWLNPATGSVAVGTPLTGGSMATVTAPFSGPSVLYLRHA